MKNLKFIKWLCTYNHEKQSPQRFARYAVMLIMLLTLGVGQMWGAPGARYYLTGNPKGDWNKGEDYKIKTWFEKDGKYVFYIYAANNHYFRLKKDDDSDYAPSSNGSTDQGYGTYTNANAWKYNGNSGIVRFGVDETAGDNGEHYPYVFWGKIDIKIKHNWNNEGSWTEEAMETHSDGTYTYTGRYSGANATNVGIGSDGATMKYITNASLVGNPQAGDMVKFTYNSSGYKGFGTQSQNTGSLTITRLWVVQFDMNGHGSAIDNQYIYPGNTASTPSAPSVTGYTFGGWYSDDGCTTPYSFSTAVTADITIYAKWTPNPYDVILDVNGGSSANQTVTAIYDAEMPTELKGGGAIVVPTKTGYDFAGYFANSNGTGTQYYNADLTSNHVWDVATDNMHIYAKWTAQNYTVTFNRNGGVDGTTTSQTVTYNAATTTIPTANLPTYSGKGFDGFWTGEGGTGTQVINDKGEWIASVDGYTDGSKNWIRTSGCTLYARWLTPGYYAVGEFNNWKAQAVMTSTGVTNEVGWESDEILKRTFERDGDMNLKSYFKIRQVAAGAGNTDTWYGLNSDNEFGRDITKTIKSGESNMKLQIYYDGQYTFKLNTSTKSLTVVVPVKNRLEIYNINGATSGTVDGHSIPWYSDDWEDADVSNTVTQTVELERGKYYKFKPVYDSYYYGKSPEVAITYNATPPTTSALVAGEADLKITADLKGDYKFDFNYSTKVLKVTYPTRRLVTYTVSTVRSGNGTESGANGSLTATNVDDSNYDISNVSNYVADGNTVTFTAPTAKSGYTWRGWFNKNNPSNWTDGKVSEDNNLTYTTTVSSDMTVYAIYSEDTYSVTVDSTSNYVASSNYGGCVKVSDSKVGSVSNVGVASYAEITALPTNAAWRFKEWQFSSNITHEGYTSTSNPIHINATAADQTVTAVFEPRYGLVGSRKADGNPAEGMPNREGTTWENEYAADFEVISFTAVNTINGVDLECTRTLLPNREYKFQVYDRTNKTRRGCTTSGGGTMPSGANWELNGTNDVWLSTAGYGDYTFKITKMGEASNYYPSLEIVRPASSKLTLGWGYAQIDALNTVTSGSTGGSVTAQTTESGKNYTITNNQYVANGGSITFTAAPATGYTLEGWYTDDDYAVGHKISADASHAISTNTLTVSSISADVVIYAKFVETSTSVTISHNTHGHVEIGGATVTSTTTGVTTTRALVAVPDDGYYLASWTLSDGADFVLEDKSDAEDVSVTLRGSGAGTASTLTANFVELDKVYFKNSNADNTAPLWTTANIYVYYGIGWDGSTYVYTNSNTSYRQSMTKIGDSNIWWAYVPRAFTKESGDNKNIAFATNQFGTSTTFNAGKAASRGDYNRAINMFVPCHSIKKAGYNGVDYYDDGYWKNYGLAGEKSGYKILRWDGSKYVNPASKGTGDDYQFVVIDDNTISYELRIDNTTDEHHNCFKIYTVGNTSYTTAKGTPGRPGITITTTNCNSLIGLKDYNTNSNPYFEITPTSDGIYTLIIDQSADTMTIKVDYPLAVGDYKLVHSYTNGTAKISQSDIIKSAELATRTYSMFIDNYSTHSPSLLLKKCTDISDSKPVWSDGTAVSMTGFKSDTAGVFQFKVSVTTDVATISNIAVYDGEYYIKTDIGSGGWTAYKANVMEKNTLTFNKADSKTFDRSYCHWVGSTSTNIKCVIANDYNIAVSDTLVGDAIIGVGNQTLPSAAHVRFSYNSTTNELKRTYLAVSGVDHLILEGNTLSTGTVYLVHNPSTHSNYTNNKATLDNVSNFTFGLDIEACEEARVRLSAKYNNVVQYLIGEAGSVDGATNANTVEIMGGTTDLEKYNTLRISYDFKTNQLLSAWLPPTSGNTTPKAINADVMIIREEQGDARQITFANLNEAISKVDTVYGVMKFNKYSLNNRNKTNTADSIRSAYARDLYC